MKQVVSRCLELVFVLHLVGSALSPSALAGVDGLLYPDMVPYLSADAPSNLRSLQDWSLNGNTLLYGTLFSNQGDGLFEIRKGEPISPGRNELLQRVYIGTDFGSEYVDISIGNTPIPGTVGTDNPNDTNLIWFEDFTHFSLLTAPVVDGVLTVGEEVVGVTKTSWRLSANTGPLPGYESAPRYTSPDQSVQQRISVGWADMYSAGSRGQSMDITGVPIGPLYWLQQTVDPENRIHETDETNNTARVLIDLRNPGQVLMADGQFLQPGDAPLPTDGDLTLDGVVDLDDWLAFKASAETSLEGLGERHRLVLGDLNLDGRHTLSDAVLFRQYYDAENGAGAFAALQSSIPEPASLMLVGIGAVVAGAMTRRQLSRAASVLIAFAAFAAGSSARVASAKVVLFHEDFDELVLGPNVDESLTNANAWTDTPPAGWTVDDSGIPYLNDPNRGVAEWKGWSFADKQWWIDAADNQRRSEFTLAEGTVAVADPDEWDDTNPSPVNGGSFLGYYNAWMQTPEIALGGSAPGSVKLSFASSWRDECCDDGPGTNSQTAVVRASYDGGVTFGEALRWDSTSGSAYFKDDSTNEQVRLNLDNPANASSVILEFGLLNAGNDWWWAVDNLEVFAPTSLMVDVATGEGTIVGADDLTGYEITSASGSLDPAAWRLGNLDAQNFGSLTPATADFNNDGHVDAADYTLWRDGAASGSYSEWAAQYGAVVGPSQAWETVIANDGLLYEFFLGGVSDFAGQSIGKVFDTAGGQQDLHFRYASADGQEIEGGVTYVGSVAIPEPGAAVLIAIAIVAPLLRRRSAR